MKRKIILSLTIAGVLLLGSITTITMVDAQKPPEKDPDEDGLLEGIVWEIIGMLKHPDWGLEILDDEIEHIHDEIHDTEYGLPEIDTEVEYNTALLEDPGFGLEEIKREVRHIELNVTSPDFGLEEIHGDVHNLENEHDTRMTEHDNLDSRLTTIENKIDALGQTNIRMYKVYVDLRSNYYELTPKDCNLITKEQQTCALLPDGDEYNMWGIKATCPSDDLACGEMTFTSIKNMDDYEIVNSYEDTINLGGAMSPNIINGLIIDENYAVMTAGPVPSVGVVGFDTNNLWQLGPGVVYGQSVYVHTALAPYYGVAEFTIYAPVGTEFEQIWDCDGIETSCSRSTPPAIVDDTPSNDLLYWTDIIT